MAWLNFGFLIMSYNIHISLRNIFIKRSRRNVFQLFFFFQFCPHIPVLLSYLAPALHFRFEGFSVSLVLHVLVVPVITFKFANCGPRVRAVKSAVS